MIGGWSMTSGEAKRLTDLIAGGNVKDSVFREMVEELPVAIYTTDAEGRLTYFNAAAAKLSGRVLHNSARTSGASPGRFSCRTAHLCRTINAPWRPR